MNDREILGTRWYVHGIVSIGVVAYKLPPIVGRGSRWTAAIGADIGGDETVATQLIATTGQKLRDPAISCAYFPELPAEQFEGDSARA
jgi:hypothetical protein